MIDQQELRRITHEYETLGLRRLDPVLGDLLRKIRPDANNPIDFLLYPFVVERYKKLLGDYIATGFINVPAPFLPTGLPVALQQSTGAVVSISALGSAGIIGAPGAGKSTFKHNTVNAAIAQGKNVILMDPKHDDHFLTTLYPFETVDETFPYNLLERPPWKTVEQFIDETKEWFCLCFFAGDQQGAVLQKSLTMAFAQQSDPCWEDVHKIIDSLATQKALFQWQQACLWLSQKLHRIKSRYPLSYASRRRGYIGLLDKNLHFPMESMDDVGEWEGVVTINHIFQRNKATKDRSNKTVAFIDEAIGLVHKGEHGRIGRSPIIVLLERVREYGPHLCLTLLSLSQADPILPSLLATIVILAGVQDPCLRAAGLTPLQANTAKHLRCGDAIMLFLGQLPWGIRVTFRPIPEEIRRRRPAPRAITTPLLPTPLPTPTTPTPPPTPAAVLPVTTAAEPLPALPEPPLTPIAPPAPPSTPVTLIDQRPSGEPFLEPLKIAFLQYVGNEVVATTAATYKAISVHPERGNTIKAELQNLQYIETGKIVVREARGGTAQGIRLTTLGYQRLGAAPRLTKGTGLQSAYLCHTLHRSIRGSVLEPSLDLPDGEPPKQPDLLVRIDNTIHKALVDDVKRQTLAWLGRTIDLPDGVLVALEIETGDATNIGRSIKRNIDRDRLAGLKTVIFCVTPAQFSRALPIIKNTKDEQLLIIDVLKLLTALRKEH